MLRTSAHVIIALATISGSLFALSRDIPLSQSLQKRTPNQAAVFNVDNVTPKDLLDKYDDVNLVSQEKIRIFLMPGHEPEFGGTEYKNVIERDLNVILAQELKKYLDADGRYEVVLGRDSKGWNPVLATYFKDTWEEIKKWRDEQIATMKKLVKEGKIELVEDPMTHLKVSSNVATRLYGINKWIGENDFDIAIHLHINDYGSRLWNRSGDLSGYVVFIPESQYSNSGAAKMVASSISARLDQFFPQSDAKREKGGVVEDQELVALGRYNTADVPALLIEYGYIYEPQFQKKEVRDLALKEYAYQTYLGLQEFFAKDPNEGFVFKTATLPYVWTKKIELLGEHNNDVFALQIALHKQGLYPPAPKTLSSCPLSGVFGACTRSALVSFQKKYSIANEEGIVGPKTINFLNTLFR